MSFGYIVKMVKPIQSIGEFVDNFQTNYPKEYAQMMGEADDLMDELFFNESNEKGNHKDLIPTEYLIRLTAGIFTNYDSGLIRERFIQLSEKKDGTKIAHTLFDTASDLSRYQNLAIGVKDLAWKIHQLGQNHLNECKHPKFNNPYQTFNQ